MRRWIIVVGVAASGCTAVNPAFRADESGSSGGDSDPTMADSTTGQQRETEGADAEASSSSDGSITDVASAVECGEEQIEMIEWCMAGVEWQSVLEPLEPGAQGRGPWREDLYLPCIAGGSNKYLSDQWLEANGLSPDPATAYFEEFCGDDSDDWWCRNIAAYDGSVLQECAFRFSEGLAFDDRFGDPEFDAIRSDLRSLPSFPGCAGRCVESAHAATFSPATGPTLAGDAMKWALAATSHRFMDPEIRRYEDPPILQLEVALEQFSGESGWEFASAGPLECGPAPVAVIAMQRESRIVLAVELTSC